MPLIAGPVQTVPGSAGTGVREWFGAHRYHLVIAVSAVSLVFSYFGWLGETFFCDPAWVAIVACGLPIAREGLGALFRGRLKAALLITIALVAAVSVGEHFAAGEVAVIMAIGELLEERTVRRAQEGIRKLMTLAPETARVRRPEGDVELPADRLQVGDVALVKPGETIPADGTVLSGVSSVNQAAITGESLPVDKKKGDTVFAGTSNHHGALEIRVERPAQDTTLARVVQLVSQAELEKTPVVRTVDRWAGWIVPSALVGALAVYFWTGEVVRAVTILIVVCPCALVLATPTAVRAALANAARNGILVKSGTALEVLSRVDTILLDKTGTLTTGQPAVADLQTWNGYGTQEVLTAAAAVEKFSEHPLALAVFKKAASIGLNVPDPDSFQAHPGLGVHGLTGGRRVTVGNRVFLAGFGIEVHPEAAAYIAGREERGEAVLLVGLDQNLAGVIAVSDPLKAETPAAVAQLKQLVPEVRMLTGDNPGAAAVTAAQAGITAFEANQLPGTKAAVVKGLRVRGRKVVMAGDGINDAPALAAADVGIAMGAAGSDIAVDTADVALMADDPAKIPLLIRLSRKTVRVIHEGIALSLAVNLAAAGFAACGLLGPAAAALVHNGTAVGVIANATRLINHGRQRGKGSRLRLVRPAREGV